MTQESQATIRAREAALVRIAELRAKLIAPDLVCAGTLQRRTKVCGKSACRCATDPAARHGPYFEWTRVVGGRLVHSMLLPEQAERMAKAIASYRRLRKLLKKWEVESMKVMGIKPPRRQPPKK